MRDTVELALWLKAQNLRPRQVQEFIPTPMSMAACMYYTGIDPLTMTPVEVTRDLREKRQMKALLFWWDAEHWPLSREALRALGRHDLIGHGPRCLVPPEGRFERAGPPPKHRTATHRRHAPQPDPRRR
jgi:radical SAM superfamily enzyme YgiQ (UPF0313 family)